MRRLRGLRMKGIETCEKARSSKKCRFFGEETSNAVCQLYAKLTQCVLPKGF